MVTAFRLVDGRVVAVVRGHVAEGSQPAGAPSGTQKIRGVFLASDHASHRPNGAVRLQALAQTWPNPLISGYITLDAEGAAKQGLEPAKAQLPEQKGTSMHQGYALQWWVFAVAAIAFGVFLSRQFQVEERKRLARSQAGAKTKKD